jgi:hypothetical protein
MSSAPQGGGGCAGTVKSYGELEGLWIAAGGAKSMAPLMAASALAESSGCTTARNPSGATGLWQILGAVDPGDQDQLTNPQVNAREAVLKFQTQGLTAWSTYTSGAYKAFLRQGVAPVGGGGGSSSGGAGGTSASGTCLVGIANVDAFKDIPLVGSLFPTAAVCFVSKSEARAWLGGTLMAAGGLVLALGVLVLAGYGLGHKKSQQAVQAVPVVGGPISRTGGGAGGAAPAGEAAELAVA